MRVPFWRRLSRLVLASSFTSLLSSEFVETLWGIVPMDGEFASSQKAKNGGLLSGEILLIEICWEWCRGWSGKWWQYQAHSRDLTFFISGIQYAFLILSWPFSKLRNGLGRVQRHFDPYINPTHLWIQRQLGTFRANRNSWGALQLHGSFLLFRFQSSVNIFIRLHQRDLPHLHRKMPP